MMLRLPGFLPGPEAQPWGRALAEQAGDGGRVPSQSLQTTVNCQDGESGFA